MNLLLVEDEDPKREHLESFIKKNIPNAEIDVARSVRSAVDSLRSGSYDLIFLDMSLPTFDIDATESGGRPLGFGGIEVMSYMELLDLRANVVVVTAFEVFAANGKVVDLSDLEQELRSNFSDLFKGLVYYNAITGAWVDDLNSLIISLGLKE